MQARIRFGLIIGVIGLVLNICVAAFFGFCGPVLSLIAGGVAGFLAVQQEKPLMKNEGARAGATAGGIAGGLSILGQIIGGLGALLYMQSAGVPSIFGQPTDLSNPATQIGFYFQNRDADSRRKRRSFFLNQRKSAFFCVPKPLCKVISL